MLGRRRIMDSKVPISVFFHFKRKRRENAKFELLLQAGSYVWLTYQEAYDAAIRMGSAMRSRGVNPVSATSIEMVLLGVFILQMIRWNFRKSSEVFGFWVLCFSGRQVWDLWIQLPRMDNCYGGIMSIGFAGFHINLANEFCS